MSGGSMAMAWKPPETASPTLELEPYRRLIALQKEIIQLARHNDRERRACEALLEQVSAPGASADAPPASLRRKVTRWFSPAPGMTAKTKLIPLGLKEPATC